MAATYVQISRDELEAWLNTIKSNPAIKGWSRDSRFQGVYLVHLSEMVSVKLSSTIGTTDDAKGRGKASMNLSLVSKLYPEILLNRKARDRKHFKRTTNWKTTWLEGILHWAGVYAPKADFYDNIARVPDRSKYKEEWIKIIEDITDWSNNKYLVKYHDSLTRDFLLWPNQENLIKEIAGERAGASGQNSPVTPLDAELLRELYRRAQRAGEQRAMGEIKRLGLDAVGGKAPSPADLETFNSLRSYFKV